MFFKVSTKINYYIFLSSIIYNFLSFDIQENQLLALSKSKDIVKEVGIASKTCTDSIRQNNVFLKERQIESDFKRVGMHKVLHKKSSQTK